MIRLDNVTLVAIDCFKPWRTLQAMRSASKFVIFADRLILTDTTKHRIGDADIRVSHHIESDLKATRPNAEHYKLPTDYEVASLCELSKPEHGIRTSHVLFMEWDSGVGNPWIWNEPDPITGRTWGSLWLEVDYVGAPWPPHCEPGWAACDETNNVGNAGFSLRSMHYLKTTARALEHFKDEELVKRGCISSDMHPCRSWRPWMEEQGVVFATDRVAGRFSCENMIYAGQFGWHGRWTAEMNGWGGELADVRPAGH